MSRSGIAVAVFLISSFAANLAMITRAEAYSGKQAGGLASTTLNKLDKTLSSEKHKKAHSVMKSISNK